MERVSLLSVVTQEADTVECFVRHHAPLCDRFILIVRHPDSALMGILNGLKAEGMPLVIVRENDRDAPPLECLSEQIRSSARLLTADWILPLSPDEFLVLPPGRSFPDILRQLPRDRITLIPKQTYIPTPEDNVFAPTMLRRIIHRRVAGKEATHALLIPSACVREQSVLRDTPPALVDHLTGTSCDTLRSAVLHLAHFPVRSSEQLTTAILTSVIDAVLQGDSGSAPWKPFFDRAARGDAFSAAELRNIALRYGLPDGASAFTVVRDPIPTTVTALRYPQTHGHPLETLTRTSMTLAAALAASRSRGTRKPSEGLLRDFARLLEESIATIAPELAPLLEENGMKEASPQEGALVLALGMLAAHARVPVTMEQTALHARMALAAAMPTLPPRWTMLREILERPKLRSTLEMALRTYTSTLAAMPLPAYADACRTLQGNEDWYSAVLHILLERLGTAHAAHATPGVAVLAANASHALLQDVFGISEGMASRTVCIADPSAGAGDMLREMLRRMTIAVMRQGTNASALHEEFRMRVSAHTASDILATFLHLQCAMLLEHYNMPFPRGSTIDVTVGALQRTKIERPLGHNPAAVAVVCTRLPFSGSSGMYSTTSLLQKATLREYTRLQEKFGTDADVQGGDLLHALAALQTILERSERSIGIVVAPRFLLHASALRDVRRHLTESFEQIWVLDLHGDAGAKTAGDEALPESDPTGLCMIALVRGKGIAQHILCSNLRGLRLEKMHALFSRSFKELPWQRIGPEHPMYLLLPR